MNTPDFIDLSKKTPWDHATWEGAWRVIILNFDPWNVEEIWRLILELSHTNPDRTARALVRAVELKREIE